MKAVYKILGVIGILSAAVPASALTVTSVRIENAIPDWLQVAELQAFQGTTNVALASAGATATGSGNYSAQSNPFEAIDGNTTGNYPNIYHSDSPSAGEYLLVTFDAAYDITKLTIFGRTDCCSARDSYNYTLFNGSDAVATGSLDVRTEASSSASATFASVAAVPEPATWAMMIMGVGAAGAAMRTRRRTALLTA